MIRGINHLTLGVPDLERSLAFYRDVLGLELVAKWPQGAYLRAGTLWLCLAVDAMRSRELPRDYTHVALDVGVEDFATLALRITASQALVWQENRSEGLSFYFLDPDGHKLELYVGSLESRLAGYRAHLPVGMELVGVKSGAKH